MRNSFYWMICCLLLLFTADHVLADSHASPPNRIVTLAPAITQILIDLGQEGSLIAVAENDMAAPAGLPVVGNFLQVNIEGLIAVKPTHVFMMAGRGGVPANLKQLADVQGFELVGYPYPKTIEDLSRIIADDPDDGDARSEDEQIVSIGTMLGVQEKAAAVRNAMLLRLQELKVLTDGQPNMRVLMVIYTSPLMASGPGSIHDQLLGYIGATNAAADATTSAPTFDREKLLACNPHIVLLIAPAGNALRSIDDDERLAMFRGLSIQAVVNNRFHLINDPLAQLPTTTLPRVAAAMAKAVHPQLSDEIDQLMAKAADRKTLQKKLKVGDDGEK